MTRLHVEPAKCQGYANCVVTDSETFDLGDDGKVVLRRTDIGAADLPTVEEAVASCPAAALRLGEEA